MMCAQVSIPRLQAELDHLEQLTLDQTFIQAGPENDWVETMTPYAQYPLVGCRLENFANRWEVLFPKSITHKWLREGVPLNFINGPPPLQRTPVHFSTTLEQEMLKHDAAQEMLSKGVIEVIHDVNSPGMYHRLFMRPKPDGTLRPIIDLSPLNKMIHNETFKMETPASIRQALQVGEHTLQLDLKDAYFHIPIKRAYRKYMRFTANGVVYQYKALPFGLSIAPRIFTKILSPVLALLRKSLIKVHAYLDDWILRLFHHSMGDRTAFVVVKLLRMLGWLINFPKSFLAPRIRFEFIGLEWDLLHGSIRPKQAKILRLKKDIRAAQPGKLIKAKKLASLVGVIKWMAPYVPLGYMHLKKLQWKIREVWSQKRHGWYAQIPVSRSMVELLKWWTRETNTFVGVPLKVPTPNLELFTDASLHGYGAIMGDKTMAGTWTRRYKEKHINSLELEAVRRALLTFADLVVSNTVRVHSDNSTTVACLKRQGSLKSRTLNKLTAKLVSWADKNSVTLIPVHIQGYRNVEADALSRKDLTHASEWSLSSKEFHRVVTWSKLTPPWLDLMATDKNKQTDSFICPYPHPNAAAVDALNTPWNYTGTLWIYPPTAVMTRVINKIRETQSIRLIIVAPDLPSKPWFPDLMDLTTGKSLPVGRKLGSVIQHIPLQEEPIVMEEPETLKLKAWLIIKD